MLSWLRASAWARLRHGWGSAKGRYIGLSAGKAGPARVRHERHKCSPLPARRKDVTTGRRATVTAQLVELLHLTTAASLK